MSFDVFVNPFENGLLIVGNLLIEYFSDRIRCLSGESSKPSKENGDINWFVVPNLGINLLFSLIPSQSQIYAK